MKFRTLIAALFAVALPHAPALAQATLLPPGEQCFQATAGINGMVGLLGAVTGGSGYVNGAYGGVTLTGGSGSGATANITVAGGVVTAVALLNPGGQYVVGDVLSAANTSLGGAGSGFSVPVSSTAINSSLAGGSVGYFVPNTQTFKQTWKDAAETTLNQNPVPLDANGCAIVYGSGIYRQILKDALGNTVWDQLTADTSGGTTSASTTGGDGLPVGTVIPFFGTIPPTNYDVAAGQAYSRTNFTALFSALTIQQQGACIPGNNTIFGLSDTSQMGVGQPIEMACLPPGTRIASVAGPTSLTVSNNGVLGISTLATVFPNGNGDGAATFNLPDLRGRTFVGRDNMNGIVAGNLSAPYYGANPDSLGAAGGSQILTAPGIAGGLNIGIGVLSYPQIQPSLTVNYVIKVSPGAGPSGGIQAVTAGLGLAGGGSSGTIALNVSALNCAVAVTWSTSSGFGCNSGIGSNAAVSFDTVAAATISTISASLNTIWIGGGLAKGDGGGAPWTKLAGAPSSPVGCAQFQSVDGAWWQVAPIGGIYTPEMFCAHGDGSTNDSPPINAMFSFAPDGALIHFNCKYYRVKPTGSTVNGVTYGILVQKALRITGCGPGLASGSAIVYDNTFATSQNVFVIQVPGTLGGLNRFSFSNFELGNIAFVPFAQSQGFICTICQWPLPGPAEYNLYGYDVIRVDMPNAGAGTGMFKSWFHDIYAFSSGGIGAAVGTDAGTGASLRIDCAPTVACSIGGVFERIWTVGGIKFGPSYALTGGCCSGLGDSNTLRDIRMEGKLGIEGAAQPGASENLFDQINYGGSGFALLWHWGKATFRSWNAELHGARLLSQIGPDISLLDVRNDELPNGAGNPMNGQVFDSITAGDQSSSTGGSPLLSLMFLDNAFSARLGRFNLYSTGVTATGISLGSNSSYVRLEGPFTRQGLTGPGSITALFTDAGTANYGISKTTGITLGGNFTPDGSTPIFYRKVPDGDVKLYGAADQIAPMAAAQVVLTMPTGYRPAATVVFPCSGNDTAGAAGVCQINSVGTVSIVSPPTGSPTKIFFNAHWLEASQDSLVSIE